MITTITALGPRRQENLSPPISIPAQQVAVGPGYTRTDMTRASSVSSVNVKKLQKNKDTTQQAYEELCVIHAALKTEFEEVEEGQIVGYNELYSEEAMHHYLTKYSEE